MTSRKNNPVMGNKNRNRCIESSVVSKHIKRRFYSLFKLLNSYTNEEVD